MTAAPIYYTADMVRELPADGKRYETVHGELLITTWVSVAHQLAMTRLMLELGNYLEKHQFAALYLSPSDISWGADILVRPDLCVVDLEEARTDDWTNFKTLPLVIEIISPATARQDRFAKRRLFQEVGVPCYWIVDWDEQQIEVWTPDDRFPAIEREQLIWSPAGATEPCQIDVTHLFRTV